MPLLNSDTATLVLIDFQARLMPAIDNGTQVVANARRLLGVANMLDVPVLLTEQNVGGLGATVPDIASLANGPVVHKMTFDACHADGFHDLLQGARPDLIIAGCEAHVCVLQTVLSLLEERRRVFVVRDAIGARRAESHETAVSRMARHGADIVTTEMVVFEWLGTAEHRHFREASRLIR
jgi:nicotinamidase-related amidase